VSVRAEFLQFHKQLVYDVVDFFDVGSIHNENRSFLVDETHRVHPIVKKKREVYC